MRCEIDELLTKLRLLSMGFHHHYIVHLPGFLADKTSFSLLALAKAQTPAQCLPVLAGTPSCKGAAKRAAGAGRGAGLLGLRARV